MSGAGNFLSGFVSSFGQNMAQNKERQRQEELNESEKKARLKLFELQLDREADAVKKGNDKNDALTALIAKFTQPMQTRGPEGPGTMGPPVSESRQPSLSELLADPQNAALAMQSGALDLKDMMGQQQSAAQQEMMRGLMGGAGEFQPSGFKLGPNGQFMPDFERRKVNRTATDQTGREMVQYDQFGNEIGRVPAAPSERAEEDKPLSPTELLNFPGARPGMTMRQVNEAGFKPTRQVSPEQAGRMQSLKGATEIAGKLKAAYIKEDGTVNRGAVLSAFANAPNTDGRTISAQFEDALDAVIRARTGAAVTKDELISTIRQFKPSPLDNDATIIDKMNRLDSFVSGASQLAAPGQVGPKRVKVDAEGNVIGGN